MALWIFEKAQQHFFVIAEQADDVGSRQKRAQNVGALLTAIHVISDTNDRAVARHAEKPVQQIEAAMDIPHRNEGLIRRDRRRFRRGPRALGQEFAAHVVFLMG